MRIVLAASAAALSVGVVEGATAQTSFVNFESPHVHPVDLTPDGTKLLAVNTADNRLEVFTVMGTTLVPAFSVPVGLEPVSVRARTNAEVWVVNHLSDTISVVHLVTRNVFRTIATGDEPADVIFAGTPKRAFVSVSQLNQVKVYDPAAPATAPVVLNIAGEDPRALATDGSRVYVAIFESGNRTTILGSLDVSDAALNPYPGVPNPPPNAGTGFAPPLNPALPAPPKVGLVVKKDDLGRWLDDNGADWSAAVTWDLHDHDIAVINVATLAVSYVSGTMNLNMALAVRSDGQVTVVGTEAINEIRFESNVRGVFGQVLAAAVAPGASAPSSIVDLNPHLDYTPSPAPLSPAQRAQAIGDPRGVAWVGTGTCLVSGMGSNNVGIFSASLGRSGLIDVGEGPTGIVVHPTLPVAYVMDRFEGAISVIGTTVPAELARVSFYDPTPDEIKIGRRHLFDTHDTSALGHLSCASCHVDTRMDQVAWDLGDPQGQMHVMDQVCQGGGCPDWHPMKGPMTTQTLQGIIGVEPLHWRGDRATLADFNQAFPKLLGRAAELTPGELLELEEYVATIKFPPNPNATLQGNGIPTTPFSNGGIPSAGVSAMGLFGCFGCHKNPLGTNGKIFGPLPGGGLFQSMKIPHFRNMYEKTGFHNFDFANNRGFGYVHDGSDHDLAEFLTFFQTLSAQNRLDIEALLMCFPTGTHAAIGVQVTVLNTDAAAKTFRDQLLALADAGLVGVVNKGVNPAATLRGGYYLGGGLVQSDTQGAVFTVAQVDNASTPSREITWTVVPLGSQQRIGVDRDEDGFFDRDEIVAGSNPADPDSTPPNP